MRIFGPLCIFLMSSILLHGTVALAQARDYHEQINSMLEKLLPVELAKGQNILVQGPSSDTQQRVRDRLLQIANESSESKAQVVEALIRVLEQPPSIEESIIAHRWTAAVDVLGDLRATEAVDILVKNLDRTGQNGIIISLHYRPVSKAIAKIGEPAVPRLIVALSDENPDIQHEAAITLASIGQPAFAKLEEALHIGSAETKRGAALTLTWIGGKEARAVIERAIEAERDQNALTMLKDALKEMLRRWGNEN